MRGNTGRVPSEPRRDEDREYGVLTLWQMLAYSALVVLGAAAVAFGAVLAGVWVLAQVLGGR